MSKLLENWDLLTKEEREKMSPEMAGRTPLQVSLSQKMGNELEPEDAKIWEIWQDRHEKAFLFEGEGK